MKTQEQEGVFKTALVILVLLAVLMGCSPGEPEAGRQRPESPDESSAPQGQMGRAIIDGDGTLSEGPPTPDEYVDTFTIHYNSTLEQMTRAEAILAGYVAGEDLSQGQRNDLLFYIKSFQNDRDYVNGINPPDVYDECHRYMEEGSDYLYAAALATNEVVETGDSSYGQDYVEQTAYTISSWEAAEECLRDHGAV